MLHLRKHLLPLLRAGAAHLPTSTSAVLSSSLYLSRLPLSTAARSTASATPFSVEDYLVAICGLTGAQALKASAKLSHLKSASNPDAVLAHLSGLGLSRADHAAVVAAEPRVLCVRSHNIASRIASLRDRVGLSDRQIGSFLLAGGARGLRTCDIAPMLEFWIPFLGSFEMLLKILKSNNAIVTVSIEKVIKPNVALFQACGLTVRDIVKMAYLSRMVTTNPKRVETSVQRADELGVPRSSSLFKYMLAITCCLSEDKATARMRFWSSTLSCSMDDIRDIVCKSPSILGYSEENIRSKIEFLTSTLGCSKEKICAVLFKKPKIVGCSDENIRGKIEFLTSTLGCSKEKICAVVCKQPQILGFSYKNICHKINFMISEVGLEREFIVERPWMLGYSLEKRIGPRHSVIKILRAMGLMKDAVDFSNSLVSSEKKFIARYIDPYKQAAPMLADSYAAACARKIPAQVHL
ncbi:hypothetical protein E2562_001972 [Oryza meyeriana var. granulata]|uniref:Uncharacterized protein n=1 Tax=Oryza meyeriana var. granulata TaxID=110450 RepID=A0A6G1C374_9ORYZ|nr:hypothetical protein E2562_001972 [Oryza meyeriana var. granulata]